MSWRAPLLLFLFLLAPVVARPAWAAAGASVSGSVRTATGGPLPGIPVYVDGSRLGTVTDDDGDFRLPLPAGEHLLVVKGLGFEPARRAVALAAGDSLRWDVELTQQAVSMDETVVEAVSEAEKVRETGFAVVVIDPEPEKNLTTDVNQVLKATPGIHLRESGGLGSGFRLSLNGLSGHQIRTFIDGVPMEHVGSSLSLNNFPVNLIDRLEVYKGVVPVSLGADALGGAVNIVTDHRSRTFLDAAASTASYGTRRLSANGQVADSERGLFLRGTMFVNGADNDYEMDSVPLHDLQLGNLLGQVRARRFHDRYESRMVYGEVGLLDRGWADRLSLGVTRATNYKQYQHPDNNLLRIFGGLHTRNATWLASLTHRLEGARWRFKAHSVVGHVEEAVVDTSSRRYNWAGDFVTRSPDDPKGELVQRRSHLQLNDRILRSHAGLDVDVTRRQRVSLSLNQGALRREGDDLVDEFNRSYEIPNSLHKNLAGLAWTWTDSVRGLEATLFGKQYWYSGRIVTQDYDGTDILSEPSLSTRGGGFAASWQVRPELQIKSSFERAYRIPEGYEILGDGIYVDPNPELNPEVSWNANLGARGGRGVGLWNVQGETNLFLRSSGDFIRFNPLGPFGQYENLSNVRTAGLEGSVAAERGLLQLSANATWQNLTDRTRFDEGLRNTNYGSRVPNVPWLFGNARVGVTPYQAGGDHVTLTWGVRYVREFFLIWENLGNPTQKNVIPRQLTHDVRAEYVVADGRYHLTVAVDNLFDAQVYDNFSIQRPGRSLRLQVRTFQR